MSRIGLTMNDINLNKKVFLNGLRQNAYFIYIVLKELGHKPFWLINDNNNFRPFIDEEYSLIQDINNEICDLIIIVGSNIRQLNTNIPIIAINLGHLYDELYTKSFKEDCKNLQQFTNNSIKNNYTSSHYNHYSKMISSFNRTKKTMEFPYIWSPIFIPQYNYNDDEKMNIYICEPNINVTKNCIFPLMIINRLLKDSKNSELFGDIYIYSGTNYKYLNNYIKQNLIFLYLYIDRVHIKPRENIDIIFKKKGVILSHQTDNMQNYLYFEAIYNKLPLIHNSPVLYEDNIGYYYNEHNINDGYTKLLYALKNGDNTDYSDYLEKYSIYNKTNLTLINNIITDNIIE